MMKERYNMSNKEEKSCASTSINWYPGHMAKTKRQIAEDLKLIDIVIEILDARIPIASQNPDINKLIQNKKRIIVLNKSDLADKNQNEKWISYFKNKGDLAILVDSNSGKGIKECINAIRKCYEAETYVQKGRIGKSIRIMILGIPNVGKSSLINKLAQEDRVIVSDIAGTTRDAIDTDIRYNGKEYVFIDTAGLRRKNKIKEEIERYSIIRAVTAVERADVCIIVIDATEGVTEQDAKIAGIAHERGKGIIIAVNKWDAIEKDDKTIYRHTEKIRQILSFMPYAEILFISAKSGQRLNKLFDMIDLVIENNSMRVATGVLNEIVAEAVAMQQPPSDKGKRLKIYYTTQVAVKPPTFVIFVNDKELMHFSYTRYLENRIRDTFGFRGTALKFIIRERKEEQ